MDEHCPMWPQADFSFFFDTGGRRRCYIAPERFYESSSGARSHLGGEPLAPPMDIFSLGCVFAELFMDGQPLFDLSQVHPILMPSPRSSVCAMIGSDTRAALRTVEQYRAQDSVFD